MTAVLIKKPSALLTLPEAKRQVRRDDDTDDDLYLTALIDVVSGHLSGRDGRLARSVMPQTWELRLDADAWLPPLNRGCDDAWGAIGYGARCRWPCGVVPVALPYPPLIAVDGVTYRDDTGAQATLTGWRVIGEPDYAPMLLPPEGTTWPAVSLAPECIRIRYRAGYIGLNDDGSPLLDGGEIIPAPPAALKHAALLHLAHLYEYRAAAVPVGTATTLPMGYEALVAPYRVRPL